MQFTEEFLDKMLNFAIKYHSNNDYKLAEIPDKLENINNAKDYFIQALEFETHNSLQHELEKDTTNKINHKTPLLHMVDLETEEPGIVIGDLDNKELLVYSKIKNETETNICRKKKKVKSVKELEEIAVKNIDKLQKKYGEEEYKCGIRDKKKIVNETNRKIKKTEKENDKMDKKTEKILNKINDLENKLEVNPKNANKYIEKIASYNSDIDICNDRKETYNHENKLLRNSILDFLEEIEHHDIKYKKEKKLKKETTESIINDSNSVDDKITKDNNKNDNNENEYNENEYNENEYNEKSDEIKLESEKNLNNNKKSEKKTKKLPDSNHLISDELDILEEFYNDSTNKHMDTERKEVSYNSVKVYPSPIPLERHINAIFNTDPNPVLLPTLLYGSTLNNKQEFVKVFHGPPGTGKTYTLINELDKLLKKTMKGKIFVCAPSNIGVLNLYKRAQSFNINGLLILSNTSKISEKDIPKDIKNINKRVIFSTISMRFGKDLKDTEFKTIFIDEAAQCQEALIWGLLRKSVDRLYLCGDPMQLPALVSEEGKKYNFGRSLIERLMSLNYPAKLLDTQRRMHPKIAEFPNKYFYENKLKTEYNHNYDIEPLQIINVDGSEEKNGTSYMNKKEGEKILQIYNDLKNIFDDIVIISPYTAHCELLKKLSDNMNVHTIDSFQGREADVIILSTVRTGNDVGFWNDKRRLNVGLTRARHALRVIGCTKTWNVKDGPLKDYYGYCKKYII